jgi:hypothetical protein
MIMRVFKALCVVIVLAAGLVMLAVETSCEGSGPSSARGDGGASDVASSLLGTWTCNFTVQEIIGEATVTFRPDSTVETWTFVQNKGGVLMTGIWAVDDDVIRYTTKACTQKPSSGIETACTTQLRDMKFSLSGNSLTLIELAADGTVIQTNTFTRSK